MYYTELTANTEGIQQIVETNSLQALGQLLIEQFSIGIITKIIPKKGLFSRLAKKTKVNFTVKSVHQNELEPEMILEYSAGKLVDEQYHKPVKRSKR